MVSGINIFAITLGLGYLVLFSYGVIAQSIPEQRSSLTLPSSLDCSEVNIEYADDNKLTKEEKIALMDEALLRSLSKFDNCNISQITSSDDDSISIGLEKNTGGGSVASSDMSGTDIPMPQENSGKEEGLSANTDTQLFKSKEEDGNGSPSRLDPSQANGANGKIPEDLLYVDNDSVLQAQIRKAAVNEKDPKVRAKLWNEYRKYKGKPEIE